MRNLDIEVSVTDAKIDDTNSIHVSWSDGHEGTFSQDFFQKYGPQGSSGDFRGHYENKHQLWKQDFIISHHDFNQVMDSSDVLWTFLNDLCIKGLTIVENVPQNFEGLPSLLGRIFKPELTHYGHYWSVEQKFGANNLAYTGATLGLHIDLPYYEKCPSVQCLHCLEQAKGTGGDNEFVDGFAVAQKIRQNHPKEWEILTSVDCTFSDLGYDSSVDTSFYKVRKTPVFNLNARGQVVHVLYNNQVRSRIHPFSAGDAEKTKDFYKALALFDQLCYSKEFMIEYKLKDGDCVLFDNTRVLHGRKGYTASPGTNRCLHGAYISWDEIWSRMNVIKHMESENRQ